MLRARRPLRLAPTVKQCLRALSAKPATEPAFVIAREDATPARITASIEAYGLAVLPAFFDGDALDAMAAAFAAPTHAALGACADVPMGVGSRASFDEVVLRSPRRFDVPLDWAAFDPYLGGVEAVARAALGDDCARAFCGTVVARPGSPAQEWHADSPHTREAHGPAHLLNFLVALDDVDAASGPTKLLPESHALTNHHVAENFGEEIVYQRKNHCPALLGMADDAVYEAAGARGSVVVFDDRILHAGGANISAKDRVVGYFSYRRSDFFADTHFEAFRSVAKLEAEARDLGDAVRAEFPGLVHAGDAAVCDGASGAQCHESVVAAVGDALTTAGANAGGYHPASIKVDATVLEAREALGDLFNCGADEVVFAGNATTLMAHLARALRKTWRSGDNLVVSGLDHDANAGLWRNIADGAGVEVRRIPVTSAGALDYGAMEALVDERTALVAVGYASNALGTINDVGAAVAAAKRVGAATVVDAVHYAPHGLVDVRSLDCDFLVASPYKFFGPHAGALYGRRTLLEALSPDKLQTADDGLPRPENCHMSKWETGTANFEALAGVVAAVDYVASLGDRFGGITDASNLTRRDRLVAGFGAIGVHERDLKRRFLAGAADIDGLTVYGAEHERDRTATFAVAKRGVAPDALAKTLVEDHAVYATAGNHYCTFWHEMDPNLDDAQGALRLGFLHYNTAADVDRALGALARA